MVQDNNAHPGTEVNGEAQPPMQIPLKAQLIMMIEHMLKVAQQGDVIGASLVLARRDGVPEHGYIAGPFAGAVLIGGLEMAKAELIGNLARQQLPEKVTG